MEATPDFASIDDVRNFLQIYHTTSLNCDHLNYIPYYEVAENHINRMFASRKFCEEMNYSFRTISEEVRNEVKGRQVVNLKMYINSVEDVERYIRWMDATFPTKHEPGSPEYDSIWDVHRYSLYESTEYCIENGLSFKDISNKVYAELRAEQLARDIELWYKLFPKYRPGQAA